MTEHTQRDRDSRKGQLPSPGRTLGLTESTAHILDAAIRLGGVLFACAALYLAYGVFTAFPQPEGVPSPWVQAAVASRFSLGLTVLVWAGLVIAIASALRYYNEAVAGYAMAIAGAIAFWGSALGVGLAIPASHPDVAASFALAGQRLGACFLIPGALLVLYDLYVRAQDSLSGRHGRTVPVPKDDDWVPKGSMFPFRCWETSFCRPYVRGVCPRFLEKTACWRRKEGCFCEERIVFRAREIKESGSAFYSQMNDSLHGPGQARRVLNAFEKRERCRRCPIYAQHQRLKYKLIVPFAFPAAFGVLWFGADWIGEVLMSSVKWVDGIVSSLSFRAGAAGSAPASTGMVPQAFQDLLSNSIVYWGFMAFLYVILLTWLLRFVEWLVLKVQV